MRFVGLLYRFFYIMYGTGGASTMVKYGTLFVALALAGVSGGVWGCHLFGTPERDQCEKFMKYGPWALLGLSMMVLAGISAGAGGPGTTGGVMGFLTNYGFMLMAYAVVTTSVLIWGVYVGSEGDMVKDLSIWSNFMVSLVILGTLAYQNFGRRTGGMSSF